MANFTISPNSGTGNGTITVTASSINTGTTTKTETVKVVSGLSTKNISVSQMYRPQLYFTTSFATTTEIDAPVISSLGGYVYMRVQSPYPFWFKAGAGVFTSNNDIVDEDGNTYGLRDSSSPIPATKKVFKIRIPANTSTTDTQIGINIVFTRKDGRLSTSTSDAVTYFRKYVTVKGMISLRSLEIDPLSYAFPSSGETKRFAITFQGRSSDEQLVVTSSVPNNWTVSSIVWGSSTSTTGYIEVTAGMGTNVEQSGSIVIKTLDNSLSRTITLTQQEVRTYNFRITGLRDAYGNTYDITNPVIPNENRYYILEIDNDDAIMNVSSTSSFIEIDTPSWDATEIGFTVERNTGSGRDFTIEIDGNQAGTLSITISQESGSYLYIEGIESEDGSVYTTYPSTSQLYYLFYDTSDMPVIPTSSASWIQVRRNDAVTRTVTFKLEENTGAERTAGITLVSSKGMVATVEIKQASGLPMYIEMVSLVDEADNIIDYNNPALPYYGGVYVLSYDTNDAPVTVTKSNLDWFDIELYESLNEVDITIQRNGVSTERAGWVKITTQHNKEVTFHFTQTGNTTYIQLNSYGIGAGYYWGDNYTIGVTSNTEWECVSDRNWIILDSPSNYSGGIGANGDAIVAFHTLDNTTNSTRSGTITFIDSNHLIPDVVFNVSQAYYNGEVDYEIYNFETGEIMSNIPFAGGMYRVQFFDENRNTLRLTPNVTSTSNVEYYSTSAGEIYLEVSSSTIERTIEISYTIGNKKDTIYLVQDGEGVYQRLLGLDFDPDGKLVVLKQEVLEDDMDINVVIGIYYMGNVNYYQATLDAHETRVRINGVNRIDFVGKNLETAYALEPDIMFSRELSQGFISALDQYSNTSYNAIIWAEDMEPVYPDIPEEP